VLSDGSLAPFFTRPISLVIWVVIALIIALRFDAVRNLFRRTSGARPSTAND
jgi:beta-lactamase regulating signal transducer with metallopeptidase domain